MSKDPSSPPQPTSLGDHTLPEERAALVRQHIAMLSATALAVADDVPFTVDMSDFYRVLESAPTDQGTGEA